MGQGPSLHCLQDALDQQCLDGKARPVVVKDAQTRQRGKEIPELTRKPTNGRHTKTVLPYPRVTDIAVEKARARMVGDGKQLAPSKAGLSVQSDSEQNVLAGLAAVAKQKAGHGRVQADAVENVQSWANASGHAFVAAQPAQKVSRCRKLNSSRYSKTNGSGRLRSSASTEDSDGYSSRDEDNTSNIMSASDASIALTSRLSLGELSRNTSPESEADANNEQLQPLDLFKSASAGPERLGQHSSLRGGAANPPRVTPRILEVTKPSFKPLAEIVF